MKHERLVVPLLALWALSLSTIVRAATLNEFMGGYDWWSLFWAALIALTGGALRTIVALASQDIVPHVWRRASWDAVISLIAGGAAYVCVEACRSLGAGIPAEVRFALILGAGVLRTRTFGWLDELGRRWMAKTDLPPLSSSTRESNQP